MIKELTIEKKGLPIGWEMKTLGEVCSFQNGFAFKSKTYKDDGIPVVRITNIQDESIDLSKIVYIDPKDYNKDLSKYKIIKGDLLIAMSGATTGKIGIHNTDEELLLNQRVGKFEPSDNLNKSYLLNFLKTKVEESLTISAGAAQPNLSTEQIKSFQIPLPPLPQQKQIVSILDRAFAAIDNAKANAEQNLQNAKELFESYLQNVFENKGDDWEEKTLNQISENLDRQRVPITKKDRKEGKIPYYGASGIVDYVQDFLFDEDLLCISEDGANLLARTYPIAFSISGKTWVNNHAHILRFDNNTSQYFVEYYLNSIKLDDFVSGMAQPKLNQTKLNTIPIPFPASIKEQKKVVQKLDALSAESKKLEAIYIQKIANLEEMKKSILQKAFSGQLNTIN